ncbi:hypothetical protein E4U57_007598 [Claviceps arundinis]|uniref:Uncharacterized protein n=1 Tax=Claviceps arundinis TaxID=1623583 RepID=A0A9P7N017_9HYPO|nr:hypothetical protein E4U57_007598 [Claviceps arundinis]KAG5977614.1 hypothetical protein E4U56_007365 [Claviceps arundinis]
MALYQLCERREVSQDYHLNLCQLQKSPQRLLHHAGNRLPTASMPNYNLELLAGKQAKAELSFSNKDKYHC